jgi:hypothetical protein
MIFQCLELEGKRRKRGLIRVQYSMYKLLFDRANLHM